MFKEYNQQQNFLIPPSYDDFLWEKYEAKLLNNIINWLNLDFCIKVIKIINYEQQHMIHQCFWK